MSFFVLKTGMNFSSIPESVHTLYYMIKVLLVIFCSYIKVIS